MNDIHGSGHSHPLLSLRHTGWPKLRRLMLLLMLAVWLPGMAMGVQEPALFDLGAGLNSRSVTGENRTGNAGEGGRAASELGIGRKGAPFHVLKPGETYQLCDIEGSGTIRHIWMTGHWFEFHWKGEQGRSDMLRRLVVHAYWDGQEHPSIECPLGDFMGVAHSKTTFYESAAHSIGPQGSFNFWLPMPFASRARITLTNESGKDCEVYHQIDYTLGDRHPKDVGRLHVLFRRENPTTPKADFELLPQRVGKGRFIGAVIGVRTLHPGWWGEGEVKVYLDGDEEFPTICGTGSEDYVGLSYGLQSATYRYHGCSLKFESEQQSEAVDLRNGRMGTMNRQYLSMYRWHILDPVYWEKACRITVQQIGCCLYERDDDWSAASFWYEAVPSAPLPQMPTLEERVADLVELLEPMKEN